MARHRSPDELLALIERLPGNVTGLSLRPDGTWDVTMEPRGAHEPTPVRKAAPWREPERKTDVASLLQTPPEFPIVEN